MTFSHFLGKLKNGPFWPKLTQIWPKFGHIWLYETWSMGVQKKWRQKCWKFIYFFLFFFFQNRKKTILGDKNPHFTLMNTIIDRNWPKFGLNLAISGYIKPEARVFKKIFVKNLEKNNFEKIEKNIFRTNKIHIFPLWTPLRLPSPHT